MMARMQAKGIQDKEKAEKMVEGADAKAKPLGSIEGYLQSGASLPDIDYKALFPSL